MPIKKSNPHRMDLDVLEKIEMWGKCVRTQRVLQHIRADDLCQRIAISRPTLRRLERGDPGVAVAAYLSALNVLGLLDKVSPTLDPNLFLGNELARVRDHLEDDDDYA